MIPRLLLVVLSMATAGCFTARQVAIGTAPSTGTMVSMVVNDRGRATLSQSMGEGVERVEGRLLARDSASYLVAVSEVRGARQAMQVWSGEPVRIADQDLRSMAVRVYDRRRTAVAVAGGVGAFGVILTRGINGFAFGSDPSAQPRDSLLASLRLVLP